MTTDVPTGTFLWSVVLRLWSFSPVLIPTIIVYVAIVPVSLKVWIGAQNAPRISDDSKAPRCRTSSFLFRQDPIVDTIVLTLVLIIVCIIDKFVSGDVEAKKWIIFGILFLSGTYSLWRLPIRHLTLIVGRTTDGPPFFNQVQAEKLSDFSLIRLFAGAGICSHALLNVSSAPLPGLGYSQRVLYGSFLHLLLLGTTVSTSNERKLKTRVLITGIIGTFYTIFITGGLFYVSRGGLVPRPPSVLFPFGSFPILVQSCTSVFWSGCGFQIISLCYKMDYAFALESRKIATPVVRLRQPEGSSSSDASSTWKEIAHVVRISSSFRPVFDKPYFNASVAGVIASAVFMAAFMAWLEAHDPSMSEDGVIQFFLSPVSMPFVCAFPLALAYKRGEFSKVWGYKEKWTEGPGYVPLVSSEPPQPSTEPSAVSSWLELCEGTI
ncbi:hypothetical protein SCHPADRAFT_945949 [Schizopora paradoxa]|uniref:Uncharacterized protein n=1 Tax=Schizopora paradoxa TaxID=27342 RepID=A0A0H2R463_9AGAM|nr:hypothetical protein SCHPADRAFT_945949 [Schizopora paradoxa]